MTEKCQCCGKFIGYKEMEEHHARFHFIPDNEFGSEESWWECGKCVVQDQDRREKERLSYYERHPHA